MPIIAENWSPCFWYLRTWGLISGQARNLPVKSHRLIDPLHWCKWVKFSSVWNGWSPFEHWSMTGTEQSLCTNGIYRSKVELSGSVLATVGLHPLSNIYSTALERRRDARPTLPPKVNWKERRVILQYMNVNTICPIEHTGTNTPHMEFDMDVWEWIE